MEIKTLRDLVINAEKESDGNVAFQIREGPSFKSWDYFDVVSQVKMLIKAFIDLGINPGDKIAILSENRPEWPISYLAVTSYGAVAVPLDSLAEKHILENVLIHSEAKCLLFSSKYAAFVDDLKINIKFVNFDLLADDKQCLSFSNLMKKEASFNDLNSLDEEDLAAIVYTSGTTGNPKGVMLSHKNIISNVIAIRSMFKISKNDKLVSVLPIHHMFETVAGFLTPLLVGATITCSESLKSTKIIQNMRDAKLTILVGVPLLYQLFYEGIIREVIEKGPIVKVIFNILLRLSRLFIFFKVNIGRILFFFIHKKLGGHIRFWVAGGAAINRDLLKGFEAFGITIYQGYGLTETSPVITACNMKSNKYGSVGKPMPGVEVSINDPDKSGIGEIIARGPNVMQGYYKNREATDEIIKSGWLYTGDLGYIDKKGFLYICGRSKDVIVASSGVNVYPDEIEFELNKISYIKESCVIGKKMTKGLRKGAEEVIAIVQPDIQLFVDKKLSTEVHDMHGKIWEEIEKLNEKLPLHKQIVSLEVRLDDFPKTSTRKIKRYQIRKEMGVLWRE